MFSTFAWKSNNSVRNQFIFDNETLLKDDFIISCYEQRCFFNNLIENRESSKLAYEPSNSLSNLHRHHVAFANEHDFQNMSFGEIYKILLQPHNIVDAFYSIRELKTTNTEILAIGFPTEYLRRIYGFLNHAVRNLFMDYNPNKLNVFLEECIDNNIITQAQIDKVSDKKLIPFIISDFFLHISFKNNIYEYFFNFFPIYDKFHSNLCIQHNDDEKFLIFHYKKLTQFIIDHNLELSSIGNIIYNRRDDDGFHAFLRFIKFFQNHMPEHKENVLTSILSLPLKGIISNLHTHTHQILYYLAHHEPKLLLFFINHHVQEKLITNRPLAALIKRELPVEFIQQNKQYLTLVMPDLFYEFSWDSIKTEKKSSEVYSLPFHNILFSINVFDYYNEEHVFQKYLEYIRSLFQKLDIPVVINYHLKTTAFSNRNYIEKVNLTLSFDGHNEKISHYISLINHNFFDYNVIQSIMSSNNHILTISSHVRELFLKITLNEQHKKIYPLEESRKKL